MSPSHTWEQFQQLHCRIPSVNLSLDISRMGIEDGFLASMEARVQKAYEAMEALENGAMANPDEKRMVGHYWLRQPDRAPTPELALAVRKGLAAVKGFAGDVHSGRLRPERAERFTRVLSLGIGGSALGPMFVADALGHPETDRLPVCFIDNTDPDGIERILAGFKGKLGETLCIVTSKSGGTPETRNGMLEVAAAYHHQELAFARHAVAITLPGSQLDRIAVQDGWLGRFEMFDWVGGRTSETSVVGLLPAALQGLDVDALLAGAAAMDDATRSRDTMRNPASLMALMWFHATGGRGLKDMVVLPYKDRLLLFSRYLQQLIMESLGKRLDLAGQRVDQGISVFGNKGSTDQHAYVQQLRDGVNNFFVVFLRVLESGGDQFEVEPGITTGDYLQGFLLGTRDALSGNERASMTITVRRVDARTVGALIALFERATGFYASLIGINAYHQPGVEAGKKAAAAVLKLQSTVLSALSDQPRSAGEIAASIGAADSAETVYLLLEQLAANGRVREATSGGPASARYGAL